METDENRQIDIVIAWVDGDDPLLQQKRSRYQKTTSAASDAISSTRFASDDEIYYNIASILKYVPFCRYIYVVTDQQQPKLIHEFAHQGICAADKIRIIDHKDIFAGYESFLPTFNTRSIETMLPNIEGLSDYFIYMNDDFFFNQPATIEDFIKEERMVIYGHWRKNTVLQAKLKYRQSLQKLTGKLVQPKHTIAQMLSAHVLGMHRFFEVHHYPHVVDKNILKNHLLDNPDLLRMQIKYKFRDVAQINPITLMNHLKIKKNAVSLQSPITINYLKNDSGVYNFVTGLQDLSIKYGCIKSLDMLDSESYQKVNHAMIRKFAEHLPASLLSTYQQ
jgi:hypothetical protein